MVNHMKRTLVSAFLSLALCAQAPAGTLNVNTGVIASGTAGVTIGTVPQNCVVYTVTIANLTANAITGGVNVGTVAAPTTILNAQAVAASTNYFVSQAPTPANSTTLVAAEPVAIQIAAVTSWNNANLNVAVTYACY